MSIEKLEKLRISLKAYESPILDNSCDKIMDAVKASGLNAVGPVPLPTKIRRYCVLTSPHVNKDAREHFEIRTHKRIIDVYRPTEATLENLRNLDISAGVDVEVKNIDAREHFEIRTHKRIIDVYRPTEATLENLRNLDISAGVDVEVKNI